MIWYHVAVLGVPNVVALRTVVVVFAVSRTSMAKVIVPASLRHATTYSNIGSAHFPKHVIALPLVGVVSMYTQVSIVKSISPIERSALSAMERYSLFAAVN